MTYSVPELLLVGAAQHLVLGNSPDNEAGICVKPLDEPNPPTYFDAEW